MRISWALVFTVVELCRNLPEWTVWTCSRRAGRLLSIIMEWPSSIFVHQQQQRRKCVANPSPKSGLQVELNETTGVAADTGCCVLHSSGATPKCYRIYAEGRPSGIKTFPIHFVHVCSVTFYVDGVGWERILVQSLLLLYQPRCPTYGDICWLFIAMHSQHHSRSPSLHLRSHPSPPRPHASTYDSEARREYQIRRHTTSRLESPSW